MQNEQFKLPIQNLMSKLDDPEKAGYAAHQLGKKYNGPSPLLESAVALLPYPERRGLALITTMLSKSLPTRPFHHEEYYNMILEAEKMEKQDDLGEAVYKDVDDLTPEETQEQLNQALIQATLNTLPVIAVVFYRSVDELTRIPELITPRNMNVPLALNLMKYRVIQALQGTNTGTLQ